MAENYIKMLVTSPSFFFNKDFKSHLLSVVIKNCVARIVISVFVGVAFPPFYTPVLKKRGYTVFALSVRNHYFPSHFSQQSFITATSKLGMVLQLEVLQVAYQIHIWQLSTSY